MVLSVIALTFSDGTGPVSSSQQATSAFSSISGMRSWTGSIESLAAVVRTVKRKISSMMFQSPASYITGRIGSRNVTMFLL